MCRARVPAKPNLQGSEIERNPEDLEGIKVKRIITDFLNRTPQQSQVTGSLVGIDEGEEILLFTKQGNLIGAVKPDFDFRSNYAHEDGYFRDGETVLEAISNVKLPPIDFDDVFPEPSEEYVELATRTQLKPVVHFIVSIRFGRNIVDHHSQPDWSATIYKPAKDVDIEDLISQAQEKALAEVQAETNF